MPSVRCVIMPTNMERNGFTNKNEFKTECESMEVNEMMSF